MGLGDVKMMAAVGAFLGVKRTMLTILGGSLLGSVIGIFSRAISKKGRDYELPLVHSWEEARCSCFFSARPRSTGISRFWR